MALSRYVGSERGERGVSEDDLDAAWAEDGGTITTTEIEFSHQSSRCEESACTHASIRPASRITRVSTGVERKSEREREKERKRWVSPRFRPSCSFCLGNAIRLGARIGYFERAKLATAALRTCGINAVVLPAMRDKTRREPTKPRSEKFYSRDGYEPRTTSTIGNMHIYWDIKNRLG